MLPEIAHESVKELIRGPQIAECYAWNQSNQAPSTSAELSTLVLSINTGLDARQSVSISPTVENVTIVA